MCKLAAVTSTARCYKGPTCLADQAALEGTGHLYLEHRGGGHPSKSTIEKLFVLLSGQPWKTIDKRIIRVGSLQNSKYHERYVGGGGRKKKNDHTSER